MNYTSRIITSSFMILFGIFLMAIPFIWGFEEAWGVTWLYGIPILILGLFILFNKKEDKIERRKDK